MAEKDSQKIKFSRGSCPSADSRHPPVKVVQIQNPTMVKTTVSEFREVVQFHTGRRKRSSTDCDKGRHMKAPKLEGRSDNNFIPGRREPEILPMTNDINNICGDCNINSQEFKDFLVQSEEVSEILNSDMFDTLNNMGEGLYFGQLCPHPFFDVFN